MQHLNISLSRHTKTTRRNRQVVWLLVGLLIIGGFLASRVGTLWLNRGAILSLAPSDTILAVELRLNKQTAPFLLDWLAGVPLLSDRSLELQDLAGSIHGDLAIFVTKNGQRSIGIRSNEDNLPVELLRQFSIVTQKQGSFILLSSTLVPIAGIKSFSSPVLPSMGKAWLGRVVFPQDGLAGSLFLSTTSLTLEVEPHERVTGETRFLQEAAVALGGLNWGEEGPVLPGLKRLLSKGSLILENTRSIYVAVVPVESGLETLLKIEAPEVTSDDLIRELEQIGAFARPTLASQTLPDGSELKEILVLPELVSVEEISTSLGMSYRVPVGGGSYIFAALSDGSVLFSNSQTLLESYGGRTQNKAPTICTESSNRVSPSFLAEETSLDHLGPELGLFNQVFDDFSAISFEFKKYSTVVHFCRI